MKNQRNKSIAHLLPRAITGGIDLVFTLFFGWISFEIIEAFIPNIDLINILFLFPIVYFLPEILNNQSFGKKLLNLSIQHSSSQKTSLHQLFCRYLIKNAVSFLTLSTILTGIKPALWIQCLSLFTLFVSFIYPVFKYQQSLYDLLTETNVFIDFDEDCKDDNRQ